MKKSEDNQQNISFTKDQFEALMKLVYLGNWMISAQRDDSKEDPIKKEYEDIEHYIYSFANQFGLGEYIDDEEASEGIYYPTRTFEEESDVHEFHEEYDEGVFWDELVDRMGRRDFEKNHSRAEIVKMTPEQRFEKLYEFIDKWGDEINEYGIERLEVKKESEK